MSVFERSASGTVRSRLRAFIKTYSGEPPTREEQQVRLELVLRARKELASGHGELLRLLAPVAAADALGDPERIAAYAETFAIEATLADAAGQTDRAAALRSSAVAFAREAQRRARVPDNDVAALIASEGRLTATRAS